MWVRVAPAAISDSWHDVLWISPRQHTNEKGQDVRHTGKQHLQHFHRWCESGEEEIVLSTQLYHVCACLCLCACAVCRRRQRIWVTAPLTPPLFPLRTLHWQRRWKDKAPLQTTQLSTTPSCPGTHLHPQPLSSIHNPLRFCLLLHVWISSLTAELSSYLLFHI